MIKKVLSFVLCSTLIISNYGCKNDVKFKTTNGVEYKVVKEGSGKKGAAGDIMEITVRYSIKDYKTKDTLLGESEKMNNGKPVPLQIHPPQQKFDWQSPLAFLKPGDSAIIRLSVDSIMNQMKEKKQQGQLPPYMKPGDFIVWEIKVVSIKSQDEYKKDQSDKQQKQAAMQAPIDDKLIQDYFAKNNIKAEKTPSGVYYTISKEGTGDKISKGQTASIMYTGSTLDGKVFDSNRDSTHGHTDPLAIKVGFAQVIPGFDEGIGLLKNNSKATLYIPSQLAYGDNQKPGIPANSVLIFDVEVVDVKSETK